MLVVDVEATAVASDIVVVAFNWCWLLLLLKGEILDRGLVGGFINPNRGVG